MRLQFWVLFPFFLLKIDQSLSSKRIRRQETTTNFEPVFVPPHRLLEPTSSTTRASRKEPWVDHKHGSNFLTLPDCDDEEGGDNECEYAENATHPYYRDDYASYQKADHIYDYDTQTSTANPEGLEDMNFEYGDIPVLNRKVVNARRVNVLEHPYVVSIRRNYTHYQVGALITKNMVLTVAHPLYGVPIYELGVVLGETYSDRRNNGIMAVLVLVFHRQFNPYTLDNNILIVRFQAEIQKYYSCFVKPIAIKNPYAIIEGRTAMLTGWGRCDSSQAWCVPKTTRFFFGELTDSMLRTVNFTYRRTPPPEACQWYTDNGIPLSDSMICLGPSRLENPHAPCLGAPGAPLVIDGHLVALLAWGAGCGYHTDMPLIYTNVPDYFRWIQQVVWSIGPLRPTVLQPLFMLTQDFIRKEYLLENRKLQPIHIVNESSDTLPMKPLLFDNYAKAFALIDVTVYDIRDFIDNGRYHAKKQQLYDKLASVTLPPTTTPSLTELYFQQALLDKNVFLNDDMAQTADGDDYSSATYDVATENYYLDSYVDYY